jgi:cytoskeletal protein CcmA (bactofilin family)
MRFVKGKETNEILSFLGEGAELSGEISFTKTLRVNGVIKGRVRSESTLEIGPGGRVDAEVSIRKISINGEFRGVIQASDRVEIHKDGRVFGDIYSPCLIIEAGAIFEGRCNMKEANKTAGKEEKALLKRVDSESGNTPQLLSGSPKSP